MCSQVIQNVYKKTFTADDIMIFAYIAEKCLPWI